MGISCSNNVDNNIYYRMINVNDDDDYKCYNCHSITRSYKHEVKHKLNCKNKYKIPIFYNDTFFYEK